MDFLLLVLLAIPDDYDRGREFFEGFVKGYLNAEYDFPVEKCLTEDFQGTVNKYVLDIAIYASYEMWDEANIYLQELQQIVVSGLKDCDVNKVWEPVIEYFDQTVQSWAVKAYFRYVLIYRKCSDAYTQFGILDWKKNGKRFGLCLRSIFPP